MYKVSTKNGEYNIEFENNDLKEMRINKSWTGYEVRGSRSAGFEIEKDGKIIKADILRVDYKAKAFEIKVDGYRLKVKVQDRFDLLLSSLGMVDMAEKKVKVLKSPMPGLVLDILVNAGDAIKTGEPLLILEAMKMENMLKAPADVVIKSIRVEKGKPVEKNQLLVEFE